MKHLCCSKILLFLTVLLFASILQASIDDKSAIIYLGEKISYPMVGVHDYIIVNPAKTNIHTHGFKVYNNKIYARVKITKNEELKDILKRVQTLHTKGFRNFFIDPQDDVSNDIIVSLLNKIKIKEIFQGSQIILHPISSLHFSDIENTFDAFVLYNAQKKENLLREIKKLKQFSNIIIDIETTQGLINQTKQQRVEILHNFGLIPYLTNDAKDIYGYGVKNAVKREVLTIIDDTLRDKIMLDSHRYGAVPLEYQGYIQTMHDIKQGLPDPEHLTQYAGVVIWLNTEYKFPDKLIEWIQEVKKHNIYVVFANSFGFDTQQIFMQQLGITLTDGQEGVSKKVIISDPMMNFEIKAPLSKDTLYFTPPKGSKALFSYKDSDGKISTPAAITPWGGYAVYESFLIDIDQENMWSINPFEYFKEALRLKPLPVPDPTTENGNRLFFTHVDGDGYVSRAEFNPEYFAGEVIYKEILKKYKTPHSISIIGAEVMPNGLYPELSQRCFSDIKEMYALKNVEPATHTFTHTFFWGKIKNGNLPERYRLKPKGYTFSLSYEIKGMLDFINKNLLQKNATKKAKTVFWSGDCAPRENALGLTYKNNILNINGGDTTINNSAPWLTRVAPLGIARGEYYQIYTGAQNENVFTNDWLGPFWGFKKVVQTFQLTDKPRRLKPIDIYYHFYSGSKKASLNALRYVFDWVLKQPDIMPVFTSSYIPKVMDYYTVSIAKDKAKWLVCGMQNLKTLRLETNKQYVNYKKSPTVIGQRTINKRTYLALDTHEKHIFTLDNQQQDSNYLVSANGKLTQIIKGNQTLRYIFNAEVDLKIEYHLQSNCSIRTIPATKPIYSARNNLIFDFSTGIHEGILDVQCK